MKIISKRKNIFYLIQQFTITDFKLRYSLSILGYFWSLLNPLLMFGVLYIVFSVFMRFGTTEHYQIYLLSGIILWTFFSETTNTGMLSLFQKSSLLTKINFPRIIIPISSAFTNSLTILLNLIVLSFFIAISRVSITYAAIFSVVIIIELILLSIGLSLFLSSLYLKFKDLSHLWTVVLQIGFWATPIVYPIDIVPQKYQILFKINPMARLIQNFRLVIILGKIPTVRSALIDVMMVGIIFIIGLVIFMKRQRYFPEWV